MKIPKEMVAKIERILDFIDPAPPTYTDTASVEYATTDAIRDAIESEAGEWVEIPDYEGDGGEWRIKRDGTRPQGRCEWESAFQDEPGPLTWITAYHTGRSVALEQVQELVSGITDAQKFTRCVEGLTRMPEWVWLGLVDLARKVKERSDV